MQATLADIADHSNLTPAFVSAIPIEHEEINILKNKFTNKKRRTHGIYSIQCSAHWLTSVHRIRWNLITCVTNEMYVIFTIFAINMPKMTKLKHTLGMSGMAVYHI